MSEFSKILLSAETFVCQQMAQNDAAHDDGHIRRVVALTRRLCDTYPQADAFRAELLAWLHDLSDDKLASNIGPTSIAQFLQQANTPEEDIAFLLDALPYISYRKYPTLSEDAPLEVRIVQDADRIDAMGAMGVARAFAFGGARGRPLDDSIAHFHEKLLRLYDLLNTAEARRIALPRHQFLQLFLAQYESEQ